MFGFKNIKENERLRLMLSGAMMENERLKTELDVLKRAAPLDKKAKEVGGDYASALRQIYGEELMKSDGARTDAARTSAEIKALSVESTDKILSSLSKAVDSFMYEADEAKNKMREVLSQWQQSLFMYELKPLSFSIQQLERIIISIDSSAESSEVVSDELIRLRKNLQGLLSSFDSAMLRLGVKAFSPAPGEKSDSVFHVVDTLNDGNNSDGAIVKAVITRGFVLVDENGNSDLLIPACVEIGDISTVVGGV